MKAVFRTPCLDSASASRVAGSDPTLFGVPMLVALRAIAGWRLATVVASVAFAVLAIVLTSTEQRRASLHAEVHALRVRLAEKRDQMLRQQRELAEVGSVVERIASRAVLLRDRATAARRLANMEESRDPQSEHLAPASGYEPSGAPISEDAARVLDRLQWLESETASVGDSVAVLTVLLKDRTATVRGGLPSMWPVHGIVTSFFGLRSSPYGDGSENHPGVDIQASYGAPVTSTGDGAVVFAGRDPGYGGLVVVDHGAEVATLYGHLSALYVHEGQRVHRGQSIGAVGASGRATGIHLHYEVRVHGGPVDPMPYLTSSGPGDVDRLRGASYTTNSRLVRPATVGP